MIDYFVRNGAQPIQQGRNPADWMLEVVGAGISGSQTVDWVSWKGYKEVESKRQQRLRCGRTLQSIGQF
jgi:hypothetical protein